MNRERIQILALCLSLVSVCAVAQITIAPLSDQRVNQRDTVVVDCALQNIDDPNDVFFFLYHDGSAVVVNTMLAVQNPNYRLDTSLYGHFKLTILQAQIEDQGMWTCKVQIPNIASAEMSLVILAPPVITSITRDMAPMPRDTVTLWCNATGSPEPSVTWTRQRPLGMLPSGVTFVTGNPMVINDINGLWRGLYQCYVTNGVGQEAVTSAVFLQMEYSPVVTVDDSLVTAPIGDQAQLKCMGEAFPAVTSVDKVRWLKNDRLVDVNDGYQMIVELDTDVDPYRETSISTLIVNSVGTNTLGDYTCRFENMLGYAQGKVKLQSGKIINPDTGKSTNGAATIMAAVAANMAAVAIATVLMQL